ncbi:hypothetical protein F5882DRAFT_470320 [Hyaloscypha sp. PMI_1271]|nr:hypothetical protein F5882DRAFT_470320 [Hyaloscypha sp. PMI_1271]
MVNFTNPFMGKSVGNDRETRIGRPISQCPQCLNGQPILGGHCLSCGFRNGPPILNAVGSEIRSPDTSPKNMRRAKSKGRQPADNSEGIVNYQNQGNFGYGARDDVSPISSSSKQPSPETYRPRAKDQQSVAPSDSVSTYWDKRGRRKSTPPSLPGPSNPPPRGARRDDSFIRRELHPEYENPYSSPSTPPPAILRAPNLNKDLPSVRTKHHNQSRNIEMRAFENADLEAGPEDNNAIRTRDYWGRTEVDGTRRSRWAILKDNMHNDWLGLGVGLMFLVMFIGFVCADAYYETHHLAVE